MSEKSLHHHDTDDLRTAFALNLAFTVLEIFGGIWTNSIAVLSDAVHDAGDTIALGLAWYLQGISKKKKDMTFTYGYERFSTLGALITGVILIVGIILVLTHAVPRLFKPEPVYIPGMIGLAVLGIVVNGFAAWRTSRNSSLNSRMVVWHLLEDAIGWVAVLLGSAAMAIWDILIIDPLLSIGISLFIGYNVLRHLKKIAKVFLQGAPDRFNLESFHEEVLHLACVKDLHHTHSWSLDGERHIFSTHVQVAENTTRDDIIKVKKHIKTILRPYHIEHITVEVEYEDEHCIADTTA